MLMVLLLTRCPGGATLISCDPFLKLTLYVPRTPENELPFTSRRWYYRAVLFQFII